MVDASLPQEQQQRGNLRHMQPTGHRDGPKRPRRTRETSSAESPHANQYAVHSLLFYPLYPQYRYSRHLSP